MSAVLDLLADEAAAAVGLGAVRLVWRWCRPLVASWVRDFAVQEVE